MACTTSCARKQASERSPGTSRPEGPINFLEVSNEEEPNALLPEEVRPFLVAMRDRHPQHFGMVALGFATGWRPSMMRPLRRTGPTPDVLWEKSVVLARRSQTRGDEVREATKNATRFRVTLPTEVIAVLPWHADRLPSGAMRASDLLIPSDTGGFRSPPVLDKPFKDVCRHLALGKRVTARAMRRTFCVLARISPVGRRSMVSSSAASAATSPPKR